MFKLGRPGSQSDTKASQPGTERGRAVNNGQPGSDGKVGSDGRAGSNGKVGSDGRVESNGKVESDGRAESNGKVGSNGRVESNGSLPGTRASTSTSTSTSISTRTGQGGDGHGGAQVTARTGRPKPSKRLMAVGIAAAVVAAGGITYTLTQSSSPAAPSAVPGSQRATGPIHLSAVSPPANTTGVDGANPVEVNFSEPLAANSPRPHISPRVPGKWTVEGDSLVFTPATPFGPSTQVTVTIPGGPDGVRSNGGGLLTSSVTEKFTTGSYTQLGLAELLADQGYLPMTFSVGGNGAARAENEMSAVSPASLTPAGEAYSPPAGTFTWEPGYPSSLASQWNPNRPNVLLRGAVMAFQSEHHMMPDGNLTTRFWNALFRAQETGQQNQNGYTYAVANKGTPETLTIYHNGHVVLRSLANTGIPGSSTVDGTFPVYEKLPFQIMRGTNPDGSTYADPVEWVSYFNGSDAVHYFPRGSYGWEQSLGCVELPWAQAKASYPYLTYGSLVTVQG